MRNYFLDRIERGGIHMTTKKSHAMGLGSLGGDGFSNPTTYTHKFRWGCKALDENNNVLFEGFVKVSARPTLNLEEILVQNQTYKTWIPGKSSWSDLNFTVFDTTFENVKDIYKTKEVILTLYDGCGCPLENWHLKDVFVKSMTDDIHNFEVCLTYLNCEYNNQINPQT